ncbi:MAG: trypsin-like peptidase domain-containing protein [Chloracidobacterium sp.]|nr:trypsin-like peptidase domain-containing protein [Chloracidobacterium sp.]
MAVALLTVHTYAQPDRTRSFADIAKKVAPAIVSIDTKSKTIPAIYSGPVKPDDPKGMLDFLGRQRPAHSVGSGFIVDKSGYIITNSHVVENAERVTVKLDSGEEFTATVVGSDGREVTDLAVLKIDARRDLPFLKFGDSDKAEIGDWVLTVGSPFGLAKSVSAGIISQTRRETPGTSPFQRFIQTDAVINPGNSGGPLVNMDGEVIGVNSQIATATGGYNGVGFALPSNETANVYAQIVKNGKVRRGYLGAYLESVGTEFARVYGLAEAKGAIVTNVPDKQSPAAVAGLEVGDVVIEFNGLTIENARDMISKVAAVQPGQLISVTYLREAGANLERKSASIKLGERPSSRAATSETSSPKIPVKDVKEEQNPFGLTLAELTPLLAQRYRLVGLKGLVIREVSSTSFVSDLKNSLGFPALGEGDLIQRLNRTTVTDLKSFNIAASRLKVGDAVVLHIKYYEPDSKTAQLKIVQFTVR